MIDRNHPAVRIINTHSAAWHGGKALLEFQNPGVPFVGVSVPHAVAAGDVITAALPHLTADDLRDTPAGKQLLAEGWEAAFHKVIHMAWADSSDAKHLADKGNPYREETPNE